MGDGRCVQDPGTDTSMLTAITSNSSFMEFIRVGHTLSSIVSTIRNLPPAYHWQFFKVPNCMVATKVGEAVADLTQHLTTRADDSHGPAELKKLIS